MAKRISAVATSDQCKGPGQCRVVRLTPSDLLQIRNNQTSARRLCKEKGVQWSEVIDALIGQKTDLIVKTHALKKKRTEAR